MVVFLQFLASEDGDWLLSEVSPVLYPRAPGLIGIPASVDSVEEEHILHMCAHAHTCPHTCRYA